MSDENWTTIGTIDLIPNQKVQRSYEWIKMETPFSQYRVHVESSQLMKHIEHTIDEIATTSGMKAKRFTILNHYDIPIPVLIQKLDDNYS